MNKQITEIKEWYEDWFDSKYYHILYQNRSHEEAESFIETLFNYLNISKSSLVVDMACGKGRHAKKIAKLGYNTMGLDLSKESILDAKNHELSHLQFHVHNMLTSPKLQFTEADVVLNLFTSFGYFKTLENHTKVINNFGSCIKTKGLFIFDFMNAQKVINELNTEEVKELDGVVFKITRRVENDVILKTIRFNDNGRSYEYTEEVFGLTLEHFKTMFESNGFSIKNTFGDYQLNQYHVDESSRLIIIAQKN